VADLLAIDPERLHTSLVQRTMAPGAGNQGTACNIPLDCAGALDSRDALAKEIYNTLFDWLVCVMLCFACRPVAHTLNLHTECPVL
jgi:myosin heavy subunit